jgi:ketosteroid isomerase-like protein
MSEENVEVVRNAYDAWNRGDESLKASVAELYAADATVHPLPNAPDTQIRAGRDEILTLYMELREAWERFEIEIEELVDAGEYVVVSLFMRGVMQGSAVELDDRFGVIYSFREGKITETRFFPSFADALEAAGLSE